MKRFPFLHLVGYLSLLSIIAGCKTSTSVVQPAGMGTLIGKVSLYEMDDSPSANSAGADVAILGTDRHATTDSTGHFVFDSLPAGYYQMRYTKPGFTTSVTYSPQPFVGADTDWLGHDAQLYRVNNWKAVLSPQYLVDTFNSVYNSDSFFFLEYYSPGFATVLDSNGKPPYITVGPGLFAFFAGRTPNIDYRDPSTYFAWHAESGVGTYMEVDRPSGTSDTVYLVAYPMSGVSPYVTYYSADTLKTELTGFGPPSNVVKIVLP